MSTLVLRGHIRLAMARFPQGVMGENLDALARMPLWEQGLDYDHGTGHGVGCVLSVHESPPSFRWRFVEGIPHPALEEGMLLSDEPGYYEAGAFGIRHENLLLVQPAEQERFLHFETLTLAPFDRDALDVSLLTAEERTVAERLPPAGVRNAVAAAGAGGVRVAAGCDARAVKRAPPSPPRQSASFRRGTASPTSHQARHRRAVIPSQ